MSLLNDTSQNAIKGEADLFTVPPVQNTVVENYCTEYRLTSFLGDLGPIEIIIPPSQDLYLDLNDTLLHVTAKIVKKDGSDLADTENVSVVNFPLHSIFESIIVSFNNKVVSNNNGYPYKAAFEILLNYSSEAKNTFLANQLYYKDTHSKMDSLTDNSGYNKRKEFVASSKEFEMIAPLHVDVCKQNKYLLHNVEVALRLYPNAKNTFYIMGTAEDKIKIIDIA